VAEAGYIKLFPACRRCFEPDYRRPEGCRCLSYVTLYLRSADAGRTPYHLASHLILGPRVEIKTEKSR
jgi:hypothetical protein